MAFRCFIVAQLVLCALSSRVRLTRTKKQLIESNEKASVRRTELSVTSGVGTTYYTQEMRLQDSAPARGVKTYATDSGNIEVNCFDPGKTEEAEKTRRVRVRPAPVPGGAAFTLNIDCTCYDLVAGRLKDNKYGMRLQLNYLSSEAPSNIDMNRPVGPAFKPEGLAVPQELVFLEPDSSTYFGWATAYVSDSVLYLKTHDLTYADPYGRTGAEVVDCGEIEGAVVRISNLVRKGLNCKCPRSWNLMAANEVVYCDQKKVAENTFKARKLAACPSGWYCSLEKKDPGYLTKAAAARKTRIEKGSKLYENRLRMLEYVDPFKLGGDEEVQKGTYAFNLWTGDGTP